MVAIITGDVMRSQDQLPAIWLRKIKTALNKYGNEPSDWEIFRGDSFQLKTESGQALQAAIYIKACVKEVKGLDVRIAIGIGEEKYKAKKITESNGSAYVRSGKAFEQLKKRSLSIETGQKRENDLWNTMFDLAMLTANNWSPTVSEVISTMLKNERKTQKELSVILQKSESTISETLSRGGYHQMEQMCLLFQDNFGE